MVRRYLVTGGAGFVGSHLVDQLVVRGEAVIVLDDMSTGDVRNIRRARSTGRCTVTHGSILDTALVDRCVRDVDVVVHLAAKVGVDLVIRQPLETFETNSRGTEHVIEAASLHKRKLLFASTSEVYGDRGELALTEDLQPDTDFSGNGRALYAASKALSETRIRDYALQGRLDAVVVRLFNVAGPRQRGVFGPVVPRFVECALSGDPVVVYGDGSQTRCFTHVEDVVRAAIALLDDERAIGNTYNIGSDQEMTIRSLAHRVVARTGSRSQILFVPHDDLQPGRLFETARRRPDTTALRSLTGWVPERTIDDIIDDVAQASIGARRASYARAVDTTISWQP